MRNSSEFFGISSGLVGAEGSLITTNYVWLISQAKTCGLLILYHRILREATLNGACAQKGKFKSLSVFVIGKLDFACLGN